MTEPLPEFSLSCPVKVEQAVAAAEAAPDSRFLAGGTDMMVKLRRGLLDGTDFIDLGAIEELHQLTCNGEGLVLGAGVTLSGICTNGEACRRYPAIAQAAASVAGPGHRSVATVGGNLCLDTRCIYYNQSRWWRDAVGFCLKYKGDVCHVAPAGNRCRAAYSGDLAPALLVHGAQIELASSKGRRRMPLTDLYREDGADHLTIAPGELIVAVHVPPPDADTAMLSAYEKVRTRQAIDFPLAGAAVACRREAGGTVRVTVAATGTNSRPFLLDGLEPIPPGTNLDTWLEQLEKLVQKQVSPQRTTTAAAHYRRLAVSAVARRRASALIAQLGAG